MDAYAIVDMTVTDAVRIEGYRGLASASVAAHGGRLLARGRRTGTVVGDWKPQRVVIEFPRDRAWAWHASPEYAKAREIRNRAAITPMLPVDGAAS